VHDAEDDATVTLAPAAAAAAARAPRGRGVPRHRFVARLATKVVDFGALSAPLIALAFAAAGLAISMLTADLLARVDVIPHVMRVLDAEVSAYDGYS
jgi:hypothetical protein